MSARLVLVTGGAGFIGSNLVRALLQHGDRVRVLDNFATGSRKNLAPLLDDIEVVEGDLRSYERVHTAIRGVEIVFHQGALGSVPRSVQDPLTSTAVNCPQGGCWQGSCCVEPFFPGMLKRPPPMPS